MNNRLLTIKEEVMREKAKLEFTEGQKKELKRRLEVETGKESMKQALDSLKALNASLEKLTKQRDELLSKAEEELFAEEGEVCNE